MTLSGIKQGQHDEELEPFIALLQRRGVRRYLEIGARQGDTFYRVLRALGPGSSGVAVDLPGGPWGKLGTESALNACCDTLAREGHTALAVYGDVADPAVVTAIERLGPFDAIFIDADHRYESVKRDWRTFSRMAPIVAFHDIAAGGALQRGQGLVADVERFWRELREQYRALEDNDVGMAVSFAEFIHRDPARPMGIGVVLQ